MTRTVKNLVSSISERRKHQKLVTPVVVEKFGLVKVDTNNVFQNITRLLSFSVINCIGQSLIYNKESYNLVVGGSLHDCSRIE